MIMGKSGRQWAIIMDKWSPQKRKKFISSVNFILSDSNVKKEYSWTGLGTLAYIAKDPKRNK